MDDLLIIFYRNPALGKVKTRLAETVGDAAALAIYYKLCEHTRSITEGLRQGRTLYYSEHIDREDNWANDTFIKALQTGDTLGERMNHAFEDAFKNGYQSVAIIGTDCYELTPDIIQEAFTQLKEYDVVVGPAEDGGYYLLGMRKYYPSLFMHKAWGTDSVLEDTLQDCIQLNLKVFKLPVLPDVDTIETLPPSLKPSGI